MNVHGDHGGVPDKPAVPKKLALPVEILGLGAAMVAVMFAGRIVDLLIIPVVGVAGFYAGRLTKR